MLLCGDAVDTSDCNVLQLASDASVVPWTGSLGMFWCIAGSSDRGVFLDASIGVSTDFGLYRITPCCRS
jgi:hypothetical protein